VPIVSSPEAFNEQELFVDLRRALGQPLYLKCEGLNFAGSVKLKAAAEMVAAAERDGVLHPESVLIESSSGNLGVALAMIAASRGYRFICVVDPRSTTATRRLIKTLGGEVDLITEAAPNGGFLAARLQRVQELCTDDPRLVWLNQYTNEANWRVHHRVTAPAIARYFPTLDVLFVGVGTGGTLMGCARWFHSWSRPVRIVAIDSVGSVALGGDHGPRLIPGIGASIAPALLDASYVDDVVLVDEASSIGTCYHLARRGFVFGGSTGTVVTGAARWLDEHAGVGLTAVAIAPDMGEHYLDSVYDPGWVGEHFPEIAIDERSSAFTVGSR
jgi:2,3-diaminopropionate biosynthesis protein SbnA